jgi:hypothetical protein
MVIVNGDDGISECFFSVFKGSKFFTLWYWVWVYKCKTLTADSIFWFVLLSKESPYHWTPSYRQRSTAGELWPIQEVCTVLGKNIIFNTYVLSKKEKGNLYVNKGKSDALTPMNYWVTELFWMLLHPEKWINDHSGSRTWRCNTASTEACHWTQFRTHSIHPYSNNLPLQDPS